MAKRLTTNEFISRSKKIHSDKYDYSLVEYKNNVTKVKIICPIHGIFEQTPKSHIKGRGCPKCNSSKGELKIIEWLEYYNISYEMEKTFDGLISSKGVNLRFDFFLPNHDTIIEYDGRQHFKPVKYFGGEIGLLKTQERDKIKNEWCKNNNIKIIKISYKSYESIQNIIKDILNGSK